MPTKAAPKKSVKPKAKTGKPAAKTSAAKPAAPKKTVDGFVAGLDGPRAEIVTSLRKLIKQAAPQATESIKWGQPVYEENGPFALIQAHKVHVTFSFWRGKELSDPRGLLDGEGERMRHVTLAATKEINKTEFQRLVREAVSLNERLGDPTKRSKRTGT